jgi:hypothetical protein
MSKPNEKSPHARHSSRPSPPRSSAPNHSQHRSDDGCAFLPDPSEGARARAGDTLSEMLAEEFLESATAGEEMTEDERGQMDIEEVGGPFTKSTAKDEFAYGTDDSNPTGAQAEAFPTTRSVRP